jgi:molybdopterin-guanine dinucleotide biosynthesis protein A
MTGKGLTGAVLAGGQARRMQGDQALLEQAYPRALRVGIPDRPEGERLPLEKGLLEWHGAPLVAHAVAYLERYAERVLISANRAIDYYAEYAEVVTDDASLGQDAGPLAGVASVLARTDTPWLLVIPVDVPRLPTDLAERLLSAALSESSPIAYAFSERPHPLCMVLHQCVLPDLRSYLMAGERKVLAWQARHKPACVTFQADTDCFLNLNTPDDWRRERHGA